MTKIFYTDGACSGNPGSGGFGVVELGESQIRVRDEWGNWTTQGYQKSIEYTYSEQCDYTTNNRQELAAILHVFKLAAEDPDNKYVIYSDSAYAVNMINSWIWNWAKNNWKNSKKQIVENIDLVKELYNYLTINFFNCQILKCNAHSGELGNELADALATNNHAKYNNLITKNNIIIKADNIDYSECMNLI